MSRSGSPQSSRPRLMLVPFLDVLCFLLATFVLFTLSMNKAKHGPALQPAVAEPGSNHGSGTVVVLVGSDGVCWLDNERVAGGARELAASLAARQLSDPKLGVYLAADQGASFAEVAPVLDEMKRLGIARISVETRRPAATNR